MNQKFKDIIFILVNFIMNPIEKYQTSIRLLLTAAQIFYFFHKNINYVFFSVIILSPLSILVQSYQDYKRNYKFIKEHQENQVIKDVSIFPSGKILILIKNFIKIYDNDFNLLQIIVENANDYKFVAIKDESNFLVYSNNNIILFYELKNDNNFTLTKRIDNLNNLNSAFFF